jgi:indolepyruvate ferredoxin oxidoreductase alpha subunit
VQPDHLWVITPLRKNHDENVMIMKEEFEYKGVSVIIASRECIQTATKRKRSEIPNE